MQEIPHSSKYFDLVVITTAVVAIALIFVTFFVLTGTRQLFGVDMTTFGWVVRIVIILIAVATVYTAKQLRDAKQYFFDENKIVIKEQTSGLFANISTQVINLDPNSISSVRLRQTAFESRYDVGTIEIVLDSKSGKDTLRLEHIENPSEVMRAIEESLHPQQEYR